MGIETWEEVVSVVTCDDCERSSSRASADFEYEAEKLARELAKDDGFVEIKDNGLFEPTSETPSRWLCRACHIPKRKKKP